MSWAQGASQKKERRKAVSASSGGLPSLSKGTGTQLCTSVIHARFVSKQVQDVQHDCKDGRDFNLKLIVSCTSCEFHGDFDGDGHL